MVLRRERNIVFHTHTHMHRERERGLIDGLELEKLSFSTRVRLFFSTKSEKCEPGPWFFLLS